MKGRRERRFVAAIVASLLLILAGCSSMPDQLRATIKDLPTQIENGRKAVDATQQSYGEQIKDVKYGFTAGYTPEQMHVDRFDAARVDLDQANTLYEKSVKPLYDKYKPEDQAKLEAAVGQVRDLIKQADTDAKDPSQWAETVVKVKDNPGGTVQTAATQAATLENSFAALNKDAEAAAKDFPHQKDKITEKIVPLRKLQETTVAAHTALQQESKAATPNYAVMAEQAKTVETATTQYAERSKTLGDELKGLYVRETHTLVDIRVDSTLYLTRTSWNENSDANTEIDYEFPPIKVDTDTADYFGQFPSDQVLATYRAKLFGGYDLELQGVDQAQWDELKLDPGQNWPDKYHNWSEIYMDELEDTYCHKIKVLRNGEPDASARPTSDDACMQYNTPTEVANGIYWEEGDELLAEAIGMDIYAKAYGDFPEEAIEVATPPGISYVDDSSTGQWRTDSTGNSFWYYYGQYRFFNDIIGGPYPYYYRSEYNTWNRSYRHSGKPYYMPNSSGTPRFGGKSPLVAARFPNSNYNKSGLRDATVRNSGPVSRSGGPGGGGK